MNLRVPALDSGAREELPALVNGHEIHSMQFILCNLYYEPCVHIISSW